MDGSGQVLQDGGRIEDANSENGMEKAPADPETDIERLRTNLTLQLHEIEMLESMYSMPGEFYLHSPEARALLEQFCMEKSPVIPAEISYDIRLQCEGTSPPVELVATVTYPFEYPTKPPAVHIRFLNHYTTRQHQYYLNQVLTKWIRSSCKGDPYIHQIIIWLEQNTTSHVSSIRPLQLSSILNESEQFRKEQEYERLWIYCHHIYSREKREVVLANARNLELTGFMLIGKPGVICCEGLKQDTKKFYDQIKRLNWQRISLKHQEEFVVAHDAQNVHQKFDGFREMSISSSNGVGITFKDMGEFCGFLKEKGSEDMISVLFGVKG